MSKDSARIVASTFGAAMMAIALGAPPMLAQDFFAAPRDFIIDKACNAHRAIRTSSDPTALEVGKAYPGRGLNKNSNATHAFIRIGAESKWVELACGHFADGPSVTAPGVPGAGPVAGAPAGQQCLPFFDDSNDTVKVGFGGTVDITPKAPVLSAFDNAINSTCGAPGKVVNRDEFKTMLRAHPDALGRIKTFTASKVFANRPARTSAEDYLSDLTEAWFENQAFDHIFCGEPSAGGRGQIGGLHFHGRYQQLQKDGTACRMNNFAQNEVVPGAIYTMGVIMKTADGRLVRDARKGYGLTLSGEDILKAATRAFAENPSSSAQSSACLLPVADDGQKFTTVFVRRCTGIRTFYPDATPNGRGDRPNPQCAAGIDLQK